MALGFPGPHAHFVSLFSVFNFGRFFRTARVMQPCWLTVATVYPLGNCDSLRPETSLKYFTRLGAVSFSLLAAQFLNFA
jgi:hypothetical protein